jgi:hypothetical protein
MTGINLRPMVTVTLEHRTASSECCGAELARMPVPGFEYECRECGQPANRVLSEPQVITAHG